MFAFLNERIDIAPLPTPIQYMPRLSEYYGYNIFFKRDDLTGIGLSGNKIRKLEYHFYQARKMKADCVITVGGIQSNHCRATAVLARQVGWKPVLLLEGEEPTSGISGNLLLDKLLDAEIHWTQTPDLIGDSIPMMEKIAEGLRSQGYTPYIIPLGGSDIIGYRAYFKTAIEIIKQEDALKKHFNIILGAVGTGGTLGGLLAAKSVLEWERRIIGVNVMLNAEVFQNAISRTLSEFGKVNYLDIDIPPSAVEIMDGFVGPGYALSNPEERELIKMVARMEGIFLDTAYTGKAFWALDYHMREKAFLPDTNILFLHTGGIFGLFPNGDKFFE